MKKTALMIIMAAALTVTACGGNGKTETPVSPTDTEDTAAEAGLIEGIDPRANERFYSEKPDMKDVFVLKDYLEERLGVEWIRSEDGVQEGVWNTEDGHTVTISLYHLSSELTAVTVASSGGTGSPDTYAVDVFAPFFCRSEDVEKLKGTEDQGETEIGGATFEISNTPFENYFSMYIGSYYAGGEVVAEDDEGVQSGPAASEITFTAAQDGDMFSLSVSDGDLAPGVYEVVTAENSGIISLTGPSPKTAGFHKREDMGVMRGSLFCVPDDDEAYLYIYDEDGDGEMFSVTLKMTDVETAAGDALSQYMWDMRFDAAGCSVEEDTAEGAVGDGVRDYPEADATVSNADGQTACRVSMYRHAFSGYEFEDLDDFSKRFVLTGPSYDVFTTSSISDFGDMLFDDSNRSNQSYLEAGDYFIAAATYDSERGFVFVPKDYTDDGGHTFIAVRYHMDRDPSGACISAALDAIGNYTGIDGLETVLTPYLK